MLVGGTYPGKLFVKIHFALNRSYINESTARMFVLSSPNLSPIWLKFFHLFCISSETFDLNL